MNHTILLSCFSNSTLIEERTMLCGNSMTINSLILTEVSTILKIATHTLNFFITKRSKESIFFSIHFHRLIEIFQETFTTHKNNVHSASISITVNNIANSTLNLIYRKIFTISIVVRLTTNLKHTRSMRNRLTIITVFQKNFTVSITVILCHPQTFLIHNTHIQMELTHLFVNPKFRSTSTLCLKLIFGNNISKITSNFLRITLELKLTLHLTRPHRITSITLRIRFRNSRSRHTPILSLSQHFRVNKSIRIGRSKL